MFVLVIIVFSTLKFLYMYAYNGALGYYSVWRVFQLDSNFYTFNHRCLVAVTMATKLKRSHIAGNV